MLSELINNKDATGKFARLLTVQLPLVPLLLRDDDETPEELMALHRAQQILSDYADRFHKSPPRTYIVRTEGRKYYNHWLRPHNLNAIDSKEPKTIQSLFGKAGAHALRIAGVLHLVWTNGVGEISVNLMQLATQIVDQSLQETELFHHKPNDRMLIYMRHINAESQKSGDLDFQHCHAKATWKGGRNYKSKDFTTCVQQLVDQEYGVSRWVGQKLIYKSTRALTC